MFCRNNFFVKRKNKEHKKWRNTIRIKVFGRLMGKSRQQQGGGLRLAQKTPSDREIEEKCRYFNG
jgi:hypothetical protein